ncbi:hypothetical protein [Chromobacterium subtsugae]|uniref:hypothetical protein n=1 Tax=Chromobacterium subtsugae TaxID=251747 RepID=UPI000AA8C9A5|nr:hypothetical protein [Chromobacterium subtsugae]
MIAYEKSEGASWSLRTGSEILLQILENDRITIYRAKWRSVFAPRFRFWLETLSLSAAAQSLPQGGGLGERENPGWPG